MEWKSEAKVRLAKEEREWSWGAVDESGFSE